MSDRSSVFSRLLLCAAILMGAVSAQTRPAWAAADKTLNLYIWSDYLAPDTLANFTKRTGIAVNMDVFDSSEMLEAKLLAGGSGYDVIVPNGPVLRRFIQAGVVRPLDKSKLPNIDTQDPQITAGAAGVDPGNAHGIVYMWGTSGIGYNAAKVRAALGPNAPVDSWSLLFDPANAAKLAKCGLYVFDSQSDVFEVTLNYLGLDPHSATPADYDKAAELWKKIRPYVGKFHNSEYISALANGDICVAMGFSGDVFQARDRAEEAKQGVELAYAIPKEGTQMWFDQMAIPADAPHKEEAFEFINYMMRPDVIAKSSNYVFYANGNKASQELLDPAVHDDPAVYPDEATMAKLFVNTALDAKTQRIFTRTWTKIVTGQ